MVSECVWPIPDDTEEIDVGVVDREVDEDGASGAVDPQVVLQVLDHFLGLVDWIHRLSFKY